jgi:hypothetical protein
MAFTHAKHVLQDVEQNDESQHYDEQKYEIKCRIDVHKRVAGYNPYTMHLLPSAYLCW